MVAGVYGLLTWVWSSLVNSEGVYTYAMTFQLFFLRNSWRDFFSVVDVVGHIDGENFFEIIFIFLLYITQKNEQGGVDFSYSL